MRKWLKKSSSLQKRMNLPNWEENMRKSIYRSMEEKRTNNQLGSNQYVTPFNNLLKVGYFYFTVSTFSEGPSHNVCTKFHFQTYASSSIYVSFYYNFGSPWRICVVIYKNFDTPLILDYNLHNVGCFNQKSWVKYKLTIINRFLVGNRILGHSRVRKVVRGSKIVMYKMCQNDVSRPR